MKFVLPLIVPGLALAACSATPDRAPDNAATMVAPEPGNVVVPADETAPANADEAAPLANRAAPDSAPDQAAYLGRWTGVEGMYLVVTPKPAGGVSLEMQWDLDHKGTFDGTVTAEGLRFMRNGVAETLKPTDGDATGLKYLAGKKDCLTVKSGEGYCR